MQSQPQGLRAFSALQSSFLDETLSQLQQDESKFNLKEYGVQPIYSLNWRDFFSKVDPSSIQGSSSNQVAKLMSVLSFSAGQHEVNEQNEAVYDQIEEYFRKNFRKLSDTEVNDIIDVLAD